MQDTTMRGKRRKDMKVSIVIITFCMLLGNTVAVKIVYNMDSNLDCGYIGSQTIGRGQSVTVNAKITDTSSSSQTGCTINFQTADTDATLKVDFESFIVQDCDVKLYLSGDGSGSMTSYSCTGNPSTYFTIGRSLTLTLHRTKVTANQYGFKLKVTAVGDKTAAIVSDVMTKAYVIVGIIIGVILLVIMITVVVICICCRRRRSHAGTVYRAPQPAVVTTTTAGYPMQTQDGYQPVQHVYQPQAQQPGYQQPPPQLGYKQPPPHIGYPPHGGNQSAQQAGYPPTPQHGYAGYQTGGDPNPDVKALDPPMQPPPYPGN